MIPKITKLKKHCEISENDSSSLKSVKEKALSFILSKFTPHTLHKVAVFLNPRQKSMRVLEEEDRDLVLNYVNEKIDALPLSSYQSKTKASSPPPLKKARYDVDEFDDVPQKGDQLSEIESYQKQEIPSSEKCTLLEYWNANESTFPGLSILARRIFSVMATSSASERNFSFTDAVASAR